MGFSELIISVQLLCTKREDGHNLTGASEVKRAKFVQLKEKFSVTELQENYSLKQNTSQLILEPLFSHDPGLPGYFSILTKRENEMKQDSFPLPEMPFVISHIDRRWDSWLSVNDFFRRNRRVVNLLRINANFLDLDTYRVENLIDLKPEQSTSLLLEYCQNKEIPIPSLILFSGRGLQVKWVLEKPLPKEALPRWNALQRHLAKRFESFGGDPMALDASRVLRIDQTVNTRSGEVVRILYVHGDKSNPIHYDFDMLANNFMPYTREEIALLREARKQKDNVKKEMRLNKPNMVLWKFSQESLHWARILDLRTLCSSRGWEQEGNPEGFRYPFTFLGAISLSWITPPTLEYPGRLYSELEALTRLFAPNWTGAKIRSHVPFIYRQWQGGSDRFKYTTQKAIDWLQITPEEERSLKTLISKNEKRRRFKEAIKKVRRARGVISRAEYEAQALQRKGEALGMKKNRNSYREIALKLGVTVRHAIRLIEGGDKCVFL